METPKKKYTLTGSQDPERINFMYSPLPKDESVNPKHWDSKINFWKTEIIRLSRFNGECCFCLTKLKESFTDGGGRTPKGLTAVINNMYQSHLILLYTDYNNVMNDSWSYWGYKLLSKSAEWLWRKSWSGEFHEKTLFIVKELLQEYAQGLLDSHYKTVKYEKTDNIVPWNVIKNLYKYNGSVLSDENLICAISYLKKEGKCSVGMSSEGEKIVKFRAKSQSKVDSVSNTDMEIVKLKRAIAKMTFEIKNLEAEVKRLKETAQRLIKQNDKNQAKKILIEKQKIQKRLSLKQDALYSMKENLRIVQESETTKVIMDALNASSLLLKDSYREQGLTKDHVDEVLDKTAEATEMVREIDDALSAGISQINNEDFDLDELEQELDKLNIEKDIAHLPDVPLTLPGENNREEKVKIEEQKIRREREAVPA